MVADWFSTNRLYCLFLDKRNLIVFASHREIGQLDGFLRLSINSILVIQVPVTYFKDVYVHQHLELT